MKTYTEHSERKGTYLIDYVLARFLSRIHTVRTDNGHEFQAKFHWHVEDLGIRHIYIKPQSPWLNGKVERFHRTDAQKFYQLLAYKEDVNLEKKLAQWEGFYNPHRTHTFLDGKTPFEVVREKVK